MEPYSGVSAMNTFLSELIISVSLIVGFSIHLDLTVEHYRVSDLEVGLLSFLWKLVSAME